MAETTLNPRIGTANNLQPGGSYDLLLVKFEGDYPEGKISFGLYDTPMKITGLQKVAQIFMKILFTTKGSDPFYPNRGTIFPSLTVGANIVTSDARYQSDIRDAIKDGVNQARECINAYNSDSSSCLESVEILSLDKYAEGIVLYLEMKTLDGTTASIAMPFPEFGLGV